MISNSSAAFSSSNGVPVSSFNHSSKTTSHQASSTPLTREQLWGLRKQLIDSANPVARDFGNQLVTLYHSIDLPSTSNNLFTDNVKAISQKLCLAHQNGSLSQKEFEIANQDLQAQAKLFQDILFDTTNQIEFENAADNGDVAKVKKILRKANPDQKRSLISSQQATFALEGAMCNANSEMIRTIVVAYLELGLIDQALKTLVTRPTTLDLISSLYLFITLPIKNSDKDLEKLHESLKLLIPDPILQQLNEWEEYFANLSKDLINEEEVNKIILDHLRKH